MKKLLCLLGGAMLAFHVQSQEIKPLSIGDTVPEIELTNILNYKTSNTRFSNFKGPIIIDFFATWCGPCVEALPHLDSLQKQFGDSIQVFVVSQEPIETVKSFLINNPIGKNLNLAFVAHDAMLKKYFLYRSVPHEVLLNNGQVAAITFADFINAKSIRRLICNGNVDLPLKRDFLNFDRLKPLFNNDIGDPMDISLNQFLLTKNIDGLGGQSGIYYNADSSRKRIFYTNRALLYLFQNAAGIYDNFNRVILKVPDISRYILTDQNWIEWNSKNFYSLEMIVPSKWSQNQINAWMLDEFNLCLNVHLSLQNRNISCWILKKTNSNEFHRKKELQLNLNEEDQNWETYHWENYNDSQLLTDSLKEYKFNSIKRLIAALNMQKIGKPLVPVVLDETAETSPVDIQLSLKNIQNLPRTAAALKKYGLILVPAIRKVKMLVIQEKKENK